MSLKKLIVISDLHIGGDEVTDDFECEKELIEFLDHLENVYHDHQKEELELVILGDFFDLWKIEKHESKIKYTIDQRKELFKRFKSFGERFTITALAGNHDHEIAYNKEYQKDLADYNIIVDENQYFKREFHNGEEKFLLIGEHGNQVEPSCTFPDFKMKTDSSLAYYISKLFTHKIIKLGSKRKGKPEWTKELDNIEVDLIPYWFISKYFYYEFGPILRSIMIPMLILFSLAVPYFIFDLATDFYHPRFLEPILLMLDTKWYFKAIIFILYFDMVIVMLFMFGYFLRNHFRMRLREYGIQGLTDLLISRHQAYINQAKSVIKGNNDFNQKADFYITGHTHAAELYKEKEAGTIYVDSGSWKKLMKSAVPRFHFPSVYVPYYKLSYVVFGEKDGKMRVELRERPKDFKPKLTILERMVIKRRRDIPKPVLTDILIDKAEFDFR